MANVLSNVSKIGLGTVEIGLPYGIGGRAVPSEQEAERILKSAVAMGITYFDTARGYGVAEERIGKLGISNLPGVLVGTKCAQFLKNEPNLRGKELARRIRQEIDTSRQYLKRDQLPLVQLHIERPDYLDWRELIEIMQQLKDKGKVRYVGIALRGEAAGQAAVASDFFATIQLAYSILDQRMKEILPQAQAKDIGIITRSVLLKGALTPAAAKLPPALAPLKAQAAVAEAIARQAGMDLPTLAIRWAASNPAMATILIGTIDPEHLRTALAAAQAGPLPPDVLTELKKLAIDDENQVDPAFWPAIP